MTLACYAVISWYNRFKTGLERSEYNLMCMRVRGEGCIRRMNECWSFHYTCRYGRKSFQNRRKIDLFRHGILNSAVMKVRQTYRDIVSWYWIFRDFDVKQLALYWISELFTDHKLIAFRKWRELITYQKHLSQVHRPDINTTLPISFLYSIAGQSPFSILRQSGGATSSPMFHAKPRDQKGSRLVGRP